jgi:hypothetical protein
LRPDVTSSGSLDPLAAMRQEIERRMLRGERFTDVEDVISSSEFSADEQAALWLLRWSYVHPKAQPARGQRPPHSADGRHATADAERSTAPARRPVKAARRRRRTVQASTFTDNWRSGPTARSASSRDTKLSHNVARLRPSSLSRRARRRRPAAWNV